MIFIIIAINVSQNDLIKKNFLSNFEGSFQTKKARRQKSSKKHLDEKLKTQEKIFEKKKNDLDDKKFEQIPLNDVKPELFTFDLIEED